MTNSQMKQAAKASLQGNWGIAIGIYLIYTLILAVASSTFIGIVLVGPLAFGIAAAYLKLIRTGKTNIETLFDGFHNFGTTFLAGLLQGLFVFLWSLLFTIPGIVKSYSYAMTYYIIQDNPNLSANDAITESRKMMNGHKLDLFFLDLSFIGWYFLSIFTFGILLLYVEPYHIATRAKFYANLKGEPETVA